MCEIRLLLKNLNAVDDALRRVKITEPEKWQVTALQAASSMIAQYRFDLETAIDKDHFKDQVRIACKISGTRKGILDLGFLDLEKDKLAIQRIDQLSDSALKICLSDKMK